jgi:hypothetical protein
MGISKDEVMHLRALNFQNAPGFDKLTKPRSLYPEEEEPAERETQEELEQRVEEEVEEEEKLASNEVEPQEQTPQQEQESSEAQDVKMERGGEEEPAAKGLFARGIAWLMGGPV